MPNQMRQGYRGSLVEVKALLKVCAERVMSRDTAARILVSAHCLQKINTIVAMVDWPWNLEIDNTEFQDKLALLKAVEPLSRRG